MSVQSYTFSKSQILHLWIAIRPQWIWVELTRVTYMPSSLSMIYNWKHHHSGLVSLKSSMHVSTSDVSFPEPNNPGSNLHLASLQWQWPWKNCINFWSSFSHLWKCDNSSRCFNPTELLGPADELIHGNASRVVLGPMWVLSTHYTQVPCESCKWHITSFIYVLNTHVVTTVMKAHFLIGIML